MNVCAVTITVFSVLSASVKGPHLDTTVSDQVEKCLFRDLQKVVIQDGMSNGAQQ